MPQRRWSSVLAPRPGPEKWEVVYGRVGGSVGGKNMDSLGRYLLFKWLYSISMYKKIYTTHSSNISISLTKEISIHILSPSNRSVSIRFALYYLSYSDGLSRRYSEPARQRRKRRENETQSRKSNETFPSPDSPTLLYPPPNLFLSLFLSFPFLFPSWFNLLPPCWFTHQST